MASVSNISLSSFLKQNFPKVDPAEFDEIDSLSKSSNDSGSFESNFSAEAQFKLNLQSYAYRLQGDERAKYVNFLKENEYADASQAERLMEGQFKFEFTVSDELLKHATYINSLLNSGETPEPIILQAGGGPVGWNLDFVADKSRSEEAVSANNWDELTKELEELKQRAFAELDTQGATSLSGWVEIAVQHSQYVFTDSDNLNNASFYYGLAKKMIEESDISQELRLEFENLLSNAIDKQYNIFQTEIEISKKAYDEYPEHQVGIGKYINGLESISVGFKSTVNRLSSDLSLFKNLPYGDYYASKYAFFEKKFIDQDWTVKEVAVVDLYPHQAQQYEKVQKLTDSFLESINELLSITA